jgi:hypothetical protein
MELSALREARRNEPFAPFYLKMVDGSAVLIRHPEFMAIPESGRRVVVFDEHDVMSILDPLLIVAIAYPHTQQTATPDQGNGNPS